MTAATACRTCGIELGEGARFCDACGSLIAPTAEHAEYKQVTVLFADAVRSMDIAATVGTERLREIMTDLIDRASAVIQRYGGTVDKFTGDGHHGGLRCASGVGRPCYSRTSCGAGHPRGDRPAGR